MPGKLRRLVELARQHAHDAAAPGSSLAARHRPVGGTQHPAGHHRRKIGAIPIFEPMDEIANGMVGVAAERSRSKGGGSAIASALRMPAPRSCEKGMPSTSQ